MIEIVIGFDAAVADFVAKGVRMKIDDFAPFTAIGFAHEGKLIAGIIYANYRKYEHGADIQLTAYSESPRWLNKKNLYKIFEYPYIQLGCVRTTAVTGRANKRTRKLLEGVGYRLEGAHPKGLDGKQTAMSYGMLKEDCKWLNLTECTDGGKKSA
jgi:RimJ/RimL family protein N-acetyltransferase